MGFSAASVKRDEIMNIHHKSEGHNVIQEGIDRCKNKKKHKKYLRQNNGLRKWQALLNRCIGDEGKMRTSVSNFLKRGLRNRKPVKEEFRERAT